METINILGIKITNTTLKAFTKKITEHIIESKKTFIVTANPEIVMRARKDTSYQSIINDADYVTADGIGIVKASAILKQPLPERVAGFDLLLELLKVANTKTLKVYLLGAKHEVLEKAVQHIQLNYPGVVMVGYHHGYFDWEDPSLKKSIRELEPDLVFVGLGMPKQEKWISQNIGYFNMGIFIGVGGSLDVLAGNVKRAPSLWIKLNLEWLYRLLSQPSRWKRMLALPGFVVRVFYERIYKK
ncbi:WecB/TagA/CpsF family glycosyltransferase [Neobacillus sp. LXY-4]|uniref:WecB/TagA/CpsF family glycosyltransferase n=1 Tax=Neobacillus sp. LXY-4 TaxID=3379826 RepID=UPI003EE366D2